MLIIKKEHNLFNVYSRRDIYDAREPRYGWTEDKLVKQFETFKNAQKYVDDNSYDKWVQSMADEFVKNGGLDDERYK